LQVSFFKNITLTIDLRKKYNWKYIGSCEK